LRKQNEMEELRKNLSQLFSSNFFSSIVNIHLEHLKILCYVHIVQDLLQNLSKHTKKKYKQTNTQLCHYVCKQARFH
jgi:hypothetical protein